jgi:hypothetical protein
MKNILLHFDYEELFNDIVDSSVFDKYTEQLNPDEHVDLLNDICHFCGSLAHTIVRE